MKSGARVLAPRCARYFGIMPLYTFIAHYEGGTYVSQVTAPDSKSAIFAWAQNLDVEAVPDFDEESRRKLIQELRQDEEANSLYVPLDSLNKVWCVTTLVCKKLMLINFVETSA